MAVYPKTLPLPSKEGYGINPKSGVKKTQMTSGIARHRRTTKNAPIQVTVLWKFTRAQYEIFNAWWEFEAKAGAEWFEIDLLNGQGITKHRARFTEEAYKVTLNAETNKLHVSSTLEILDRTSLTPGSLKLLLNYGLEDIVNTANLIEKTTKNFFNKL